MAAIFWCQSFARNFTIPGLEETVTWNITVPGLEEAITWSITVPGLEEAIQKRRGISSRLMVTMSVHEVLADHEFLRFGKKNGRAIALPTPVVSPALCTLLQQ